MGSVVEREDLHAIQVRLRDVGRVQRAGKRGRSDRHTPDHDAPGTKAERRNERANAQPPADAKSKKYWLLRMKVARRISRIVAASC